MAANHKAPHAMPAPAHTPSSLRRFVALGLRIIALIAIIVAASWLAEALRLALDLNLMPQTTAQMQRLMTVGLGLYIVLLALPFVPGAEIGIALLACFGASVAPHVYAATVVALMLAFGLGRLLPPHLLVRGLGLLHLRRAANLMARAVVLPKDARLALLMEGASHRSVGFVVRHRYLALMIAVNTPGNVVIGGGGGIMLMAGLSGLFSPVATFVAVAIAVLPVPLIVWLIGA